MSLATKGRMGYLSPSEHIRTSVLSKKVSVQEKAHKKKGRKGRQAKNATANNATANLEDLEEVLQGLMEAGH